MTRFIRLVLTALVFTAMPLLAAAGADTDFPLNVFAAPPGDELQDVLFLADARPLFVRFHIRVEGDGFRTLWADFSGRLHHFLDTDGNGVLTLQEAQRGNWQQLLTIGLARRAESAAVSPTRPALDSNPKDGTVSMAELASYLRSTLGFGEFGIQTGPPPDPKAQALFSHLDVNHDGMLSAGELAVGATDSCVARLDLNGDELIGLAEMKPYENAYAERFRPVTVPMNSEVDNLPVIALGPGAADSRLVQRLIRKYDRGTSGDPKDGRLSAAEIGSAPETLRRFDTDGDGTLGPAELTALLAQPAPDLEFNVALPRAAGPPGRIDLAGPSRVPTSAPSGAGSGSAVRPLQADFEGIEVEFAVEENIFNNRQAFSRQFDNADGDQNGYVDKAESMRSGLAQIFPIADRDGDGKLFKKELEAYLERQSDATASRMMLTVIDRGRTLFEMLDTDGDQKLSVRELRRALERLSPLDRDSDGRIAQNEVAQRYRLGVGRGTAPARRGITIEPYDAPDPPRRKAGPPWFEKMDRNRDGDVSPREFLGPSDQFRRFDADGDGLIDPKEAAGKQ